MTSKKLAAFIRAMAETTNAAKARSSLVSLASLFFESRLTPAELIAKLSRSVAETTRQVDGATFADMLPTIAAMTKVVDAIASPKAKQTVYALFDFAEANGAANVEATIKAVKPPNEPTARRQKKPRVIDDLAVEEHIAALLKSAPGEDAHSAALQELSEDKKRITLSEMQLIANRLARAPQTYTTRAAALKAIGLEHREILKVRRKIEAIQKGGAA